MYTPLVRKYAIQCFDNVIGQPIVVKILKNSLFLDHIFSVYLFAGKHGCGKTSTARLFSTALNCQRLASFQKNPHELLPCQLCPSCTAMQSMQHPDFIEIDAASHTGVDNVRLLIESATLLPLLSTKKIYLIDEAHMLSKAACNAFLKILEQPPKNVVFILATTAPEKILETVRSRCFQLFFNPIHETVLADHLCLIAAKEQIAYTREGVTRIARMSKGSVRDAVNMLDQTRLAVSNISVESLEQIFGTTSDDAIMKLFEQIFLERSHDSFLLFEELIPHDHATFAVLFDRIVHCGRALLWFLYAHRAVDGVNTTYFDRFSALAPEIVIQFLFHICQQEMVLKRSENPALFFETILLLFMEKNNAAQNVQNRKPLEFLVTEKQHDRVTDGDARGNTTISNITKESTIPVVPPIKDGQEQGSAGTQWSDFLFHIARKDDPLLLSIFKQGVFQSFDPATHIVTLLYQKDRAFFADLLAENRKDWLPVLHAVFGSRVTLSTTFTGEITKEQGNTEKPQEVNRSQPLVQKPSQQQAVEKRVPYQTTFNRYTKKDTFTNKSSKIDISDRDKWRYAHLLSSVFPGVITHIEKGDL